MPSSEKEEQLLITEPVELSPNPMENANDDSLKTLHTKTTATTNSKYCADLNQIKDLFDRNLEPIYRPLVNLLPDDVQLLLLDETQFAGLSRASCMILTLLLTLILSLWYSLTRLNEKRKLSLNVNLNEQLLACRNQITKLEFDNRTFANLLAEADGKVKKSDDLVADREAKLEELVRQNVELTRVNERDSKELAKLKANEAKLTKELNQARLDLNTFNDTLTRQQSDYEREINAATERLTAQLDEARKTVHEQQLKLNDYEKSTHELQSQLDEHRLNETKLRDELDGKENTIVILKNSLMLKGTSPGPVNRTSDNDSDVNSDDYVKVDDEAVDNDAVMDNLMKMGKMQMEIKQLEQQVDDLKKQLAAKGDELTNLAEVLKGSYYSSKQQFF